jgi:hypothetical protein
MPCFKFPNKCVFWTGIDDHERLKSELIPTVLDIMKNGCLENPFKKCTMKTTITQNYNLLNQEQADKVIFEPIMKMILEVEDYRKLDINNVALSTQWLNIYERGDFQELHDHLANGKPQTIITNGKTFEEIFSVVYILHDKSIRNSLVFREGGVIFDTSKEESIKEGCVIIFPSSLKHEVKPIEIPGRITFAFNVAYNFQ